MTIHEPVTNSWSGLFLYYQALRAADPRTISSYARGPLPTPKLRLVMHGNLASEVRMWDRKAAHVVCEAACTPKSETRDDQNGKDPSK